MYRWTDTACREFDASAFVQNNTLGEANLQMTIMQEQAAGDSKPGLGLKALMRVAVSGVREQGQST